MARRPRKRIAKRRVTRQPTRRARHDSPATPAPARRLHNLPTQLTTFIGREQEVAEVKNLLSGARLLTATGSAGCGKTRLALQVAAGLLDEYSDGVWFVDLAPIADPAFLPNSIAAALGVSEQRGCPLADTLADYLRTRTVLLVLDNCEHLRAACQVLADHLLRASDSLRILGTSRETLGVEGEITYSVPPLGFPDSGPMPPVADLAKYDAVRLFVERAALSQSRFSVTIRNAPAILQICRRLDGIPLAIELAAARVKVLAVEQIAAKLDDRFQLLTEGSGTAVPRHQTLRAAIDWSYNLLSEPEKALLRRQAVFAGGWTLEAAESVCSRDDVEPDQVLDLLTSLVGKSLVVSEAHQGAARYRLLETLRQYGQQRLSECGETDGTRRRHLDWFLEWARHAEPGLHSAEQSVWVEQCRADHDNLRAALKWSIETGGGEPAVKLVVALAWFWYVDGHWNEGRKWIEQALAHSSGAQPDTLADALLQLAYHARSQGDYEGTRTFAERGLTISRETKNKSNIAWFLYNLGAVALLEGDYSRGKALCEESVALGRQLGMKFLLANDLAQLGHIARDGEDYEQAGARYEESLVFAREHGERYTIAYALRNVAVLALHVRDYHRAGAFFVESLTLCGTTSNWVTEECLVGLAEIACERTHYDRAACLFGAGDALHEALGVRRSPRIQKRHDEQVAAVRTRLGDDAFEAAHAGGRAMTLEQAIAYALASPSEGPAGQQPRRPGGRVQPGRLSDREIEVLRLVAAGLSNRDIARKLTLSEKTVANHLTTIFNKTNTNNRTAASTFAIRQGLA